MTWQGKMVWEALPSPTTLPPRLGHTATLVGEKMLYVMGGREGETFMNDVWTFDCESEEWTCLIKHAPFTPRAYSTATLIKGRYIWVVGGSNQSDLFCDIHVLDTRTHSWSIPPLQGEPMEIAAHGAVPHPLIPDAILLFGGYARVREDDNDFTNKLFVLHTHPPHYEKLTPTGPLSHKLGYHTFTILGNRVFSFGGKNKGGKLKDRLLSVYDVAANAWLEVKAKGLGPVSRSGQSATAVGGGSILVFGGRTGAQRLADFSLLQVLSSDNDRKCTVQWHPLPGTACNSSEPTETHPGARSAHTLIARKRSLYVFGGYGGDKLTYAHPYVLRYLPALDSPEDVARTPPPRVSPTLGRRTPPKRVGAEVGGEDGAGWRTSKRAEIRKAVLAATKPVASEVGDSQAREGDDEQMSPHRGPDLRNGADLRGGRAGGKRGALDGGEEPAKKRQKGVPSARAAAAEGGARKAAAGWGRMKAARRGGPPETSSSGEGEESLEHADVTETQSAAERGGAGHRFGGVSGRGWQAPHGRSQQGGGADKGGRGPGGMEKRNAGAEAVQERGVGEEVEENAAEAFVFEHESEEESPKGARRSKRRGGGTRAARDPPGENRSDKPQAKGTVPVGKSTGLADFEREHYAATVRKLEKEKDALEGLLQDKVAAVAHLSAERKGLVGEKDGLAQQLVQAEQRWAAARDEASRVKEERGALQRELEEVRRRLTQSERQRTSAEAELRTVTAKLDETSARLSETSLRREALEGTARRLEEELEKEQQRSAEARQSHERERNTLNQVAHERAAEKEALRVKLEATAARNDQLQETVSTLTRELADSRAQVDDARAQGESHRTALTQAKTEKVQLEAAKDAAEKTCAALSAEVGRLRAHSDKVEAEEGRLRTALVQAQGQNESLQVELRRAQSDAARFKDEAERLRADVREHQETAQKVEGEARQLAEHAAQIRALANRQLRLQPREPGLGRMSEHG